MHGSDNFIRTYKQKNREDVRFDPKRNKNRAKDERRYVRKLKEREKEQEE